MMGISMMVWKKIFLGSLALVLTLAVTACSTVTVTPTSSTPVVTTTQPVIATTTSQPNQTVVQESSSPTPSTAATTSVPSPTLTTPPPPPTSPIYTPAAKSYIPTAAEAELYQYVLELINKDRQDAGFNPVVLSYNAAAHNHAKDMLDNNFQAAHWGTDGKKPYMRYTDAGGISYEQENSCYYSSSEKVNLKQELKNFQSTMMAEVAPNDSHKVTMLNKWHKKVNLGIAYNANTVTLVQQFEGDYVEYSKPPTIDGNILSLTGHFLQSNLKLYYILLTHDPPLTPLSTSQLNQDQYHHYDTGPRAGVILAPPPPGQEYSSRPTDSIIATKSNFNYDGWFIIDTDIRTILNSGPGIYTVTLVAQVGDTTELANMTNFSLLVK